MAVSFIKIVDVRTNADREPAAANGPMNEPMCTQSFVTWVSLLSFFKLEGNSFGQWQEGLKGSRTNDD